MTIGPEEVVAINHARDVLSQIADRLTAELAGTRDVWVTQCLVRVQMRLEQSNVSLFALLSAANAYGAAELSEEELFNRKPDEVEV